MLWFCTERTRGSHVPEQREARHHSEVLNGTFRIMGRTGHMCSGPFPFLLSPFYFPLATLPSQLSTFYFLLSTRKSPLSPPSNASTLNALTLLRLCPVTPVPCPVRCAFRPIHGTDYLVISPEDLTHDAITSKAVWSLGREARGL